ncbi:transmembrane protein [Spatholobus suberectus]|nr:transmembrane protein [Spatholobus suberectus]
MFRCMESRVLYGPSFDVAFKLFHGKDGTIPLFERSDFHNGSMEADSLSVFNPSARRSTTISLSAFGLGCPFSFGNFSEKWKKQ